VLKTASRNKDADIPDIRADEPDRATERFKEGLRRVVTAQKPNRILKAKRKRRH
jgi:hypothetical protein